MLEIGSLLDGKYEILSEVGHGGMSVVYLAMNRRANKQWAVKEVRKDGVMDVEAVVQGLVAETEILKGLNHPNLPSIVDVIDTDDAFIIIMDYIQGNDLMHVLDEYGAQPEDLVIEWGKQLADVMQYLHTQNPPIIYRDLKPKNIMLKPDGNITLIDFGTARTFKENKVGDTVSLGTPEYAAPEQYGGQGQTDARTDIYAFGATLYHLVTGVRPEPLNVKSIREINPALSDGLDHIIQKCTRHEKEDRYQTDAELIYDLENWDKITKKYRQLQKRKLGGFLAPTILSVLFAGVSVWGYASAENKKKENYDYILANADSVNAYYEAIVTDPTRTEAYLGTSDHDGLVKFLINDGYLTTEENGVLTKLRGGLDDTNMSGYSTTVKVLDELERADPNGYAEVCYQVGEAYLFYYDIDVEKDKYAAAATWFQYANDQDHPLAKVYCDISDCLQNIHKFSKAEQNAKLFEEYGNLWKMITTLDTDAQSFSNDTEGLDLKLRVWNEIVNMIRNNATQLCEVSSRDKVLELIGDIEKNVPKTENPFLQKSVATLQANITETATKVKSIKTEG